MTLKLSFLTLVLACTATTRLVSQDNTDACKLLLKDGLYAYTKMTNTGSIDQDFKTYLLSDTFKEDLQSGKWGASIGVPLMDGILSLGANSSEQEYQQFRSKILQQADFKLNQTNSQVLVSSIPSVNLAEQYVKCLEDAYKYGFKVTATYGEDYANFIITYINPVQTDPLPKVTFFDIQNAMDVRNAPVANQTILNNNSVSCKRNPDKDLLLTLQTDRGAISYRVPADNTIASSKELPIGTIVCSFLNFEQFNAASKNNEKSLDNVWTSQKSKWSPCDGRPVPESNFVRLTSQLAVPDLRGMFLRGLNLFDPNQPVPAKNPNDGDPDNRNIAGQPQGDAFQNHKHDYSAMTFQNPGAGYNLTHNGSYCDFRSPSTSGPTANGAGDPRTATETRPKNMSVFYYIKIN